MWGKRTSYPGGALLLILLTSPLAAEDRKEFPLRYRLSVEVDEEVGYTRRALPLKTERPDLRAEPKYFSRQPLYASFQLGTPQQIYTLVLDSSTGADRRYDMLYLDTKHTGRPAAADRIAGLPRGHRHASLRTTFGPVKINVACGGEQCPQWFLFEYEEREWSPGEVERWLFLTNAGYYQGVVTFGKEKRLVAFVDADANGLYDDLMPETGDGGDRLLIDRNGDGKLDSSYLSDEIQPLGRYVEVGDRYWRLDLTPDGSAVTVSPLDRPLGTIRSALTDYVLLLQGEQGVLRVRSKVGTARVPAGVYRLIHCDYRTRDATGNDWRLCADGKQRLVTVPAGGDARIPFGPPLTPKVVLSPPKHGELTLWMELRGSGGEVYNYASRSGSNHPPVPRARILDAANRELALLDFHYG